MQSNTSPPGSVGVHISRGVTPRIPAGGMSISMGPDGALAGTMRLELQLDTCIHWLEIAIDSLAEAKQVHESLLSAKASDATSFVDIDREFKACVQATVAAATFFEALYAAVLERMPTKPATKGRKHHKRPTRYAVVAETLRQAFGLSNQGRANLRSVLKEVYRFRDEAVHPSSKFSDPVSHPELGVGVERRFVMFSYSSARQLVRAALVYSKLLAARDLTRRPKAVQDFATYLLKVCEPLYPHWEQSFGLLFDPKPSVV